MRILKNKKGSEHGGGDDTTSAGGAAVLVALIALFIVFYILFLPPSERDALLNNTDNSTISTSDSLKNATLIFERPGKLNYVTTQAIEHSMNAFTLFKTTETQIIDSTSSLYVKSNIFEKQAKQIQFGVDDIKNTENYVLTFNVPKHTGRLSIGLNGNPIYEDTIDTANPAPIKLPKTNIKTNNVLEFTVSGVGWAFWSSNEYGLDGIQILGDVTDVSRQESQGTIFVEREEFDNLQKVTLQFNPECKIKEVGDLTISINGILIFSGIPDCGVLNFKDIPKDKLEEGQNSITFRTNKGTYLVDNVMVETGLKKINYPTYYFELTDKQFNDLKNGDRNLNVTLKYVDIGEPKRAKIIVNGHIMSVDAKTKLKSQKAIPSEYIENRENNYIRIEPDRNDVEIAQMQVFLYKP